MVVVAAPLAGASYAAMPKKGTRKGRPNGCPDFKKYQFFTI
jgi:hypothetical protein